MLAVPPVCENVPVLVPSPRATLSAFRMPELKFMAPLTRLVPTEIPAVTLRVPPSINIVPPAFSRPAVAFTVLPFV